jgi:hypothetical protein
LIQLAKLIPIIEGRKEEEESVQNRVISMEIF